MLSIRDRYHVRSAVRGTLYAILCGMSFATAGWAGGEPTAKLRQDFARLQAAFRRDPSYDSAVQLEISLRTLKNRDPFVARHPDAPFSRAFKAFHLDLLEVKQSFDLLGACAKDSSTLRRKVEGISSALGERLSRDQSDTVCSRLYSAALKDVDSTSRDLFAADQVGLGGAKTSVFTALAQVRDQVQRPANDGNPLSMVYRNDAVARTIAEADGAQRAAELEARERDLGKKAQEAAASGAATLAYVKDKYGFDVKDPERSPTAAARAAELHNKLMYENRTRSMRNFVYYTQRFDFSGEPDLVGDPKAVTKLGAQALELFGRSRLYGGESTLSEAECGYAYEENRLAEVGAKKLAEIRGAKGRPRLSIDQTFELLRPIIDLGKKAAALGSASNAIRYGMYDDRYGAKFQKKTSLAFQAAMGLRAALERAKSQDAGFLCQTDRFKAALPKLDRMSDAEIKDLLKGSLRDSIEAARKYSGWIADHQSRRRFFQDEKGASSYARTGSLLLYSSPTAIQRTVASNPKLLGSMCLPLRYAGQDTERALDEETVRLATLGAPVLGNGGSLLLGAGAALYSEAANDPKNRRLRQRADYAGAGEEVEKRDYDAIDADRADASRAIQAHRDESIGYLKEGVVGEAAGLGAKGVLGRAARLANDARIAGTASRLASSYGAVGAEKAALSAEIQATMRGAENTLGRELTSAETQALFDAHKIGSGEAGQLSGTLAGKTNYTPAQLKAKTARLREAFGDADAAKLIRAGDAGEELQVVRNVAPPKPGEREKWGKLARPRDVSDEEWKLIQEQNKAAQQAFADGSLMGGAREDVAFRFYGNGETGYAKIVEYSRDGKSVRYVLAGDSTETIHTMTREELQSMRLLPDEPSVRSRFSTTKDSALRKEAAERASAERKVASDARRKAEREEASALKETPWTEGSVPRTPEQYAQALEHSMRTGDWTEHTRYLTAKMGGKEVTGEIVGKSADGKSYTLLTKTKVKVEVPTGAELKPRPSLREDFAGFDRTPSSTPWEEPAKVVAPYEKAIREFRDLADAKGLTDQTVLRFPRGGKLQDVRFKSLVDGPAGPTLKVVDPDGVETTLTREEFMSTFLHPNPGKVKFYPARN